MSVIPDQDKKKIRVGIWSVENAKKEKSWGSKSETDHDRAEKGSWQW